MDSCSSDVSTLHKLNSTGNIGWFSFLKKSFRRCKSRKVSKKIQTIIPDTCCDSMKFCQDHKFQKTKGERVRFTDDFLESFSKKSKKLSQSFVTRFKDCGTQSSVDSNHQMSFVLSKLFQHLTKDPSNMQNVLLQVVEDYVNGICEKMLHEKMRCVYRKIDNYYKVIQPRVGLKSMNLSLGGNITHTEKYFELPKEESKLLSAHIQRKDIATKELKKLKENILNKCNLYERNDDNSRTERLSKYQVPNNERCHRHKKILNTHENVNEINSTNADSLCNVSFSHESSETLSEKNLKSNHETKCTPKCNEVSSTSTGEGNTSQIMTVSNSAIRRNRNLSLKCPKTVKYSGKRENYNRGYFKSLNISKIFNVDIKPRIDRTEKSAEMSSKQTKVKQATMTGGNISGQYEKKDCQINQKRNLLKMRRSVTFLEPRNGSFHSPMHKEAGFCSTLDVRSSGNLTNFDSIENEKTNYYLYPDEGTPGNRKCLMSTDSISFKGDDYLPDSLKQNSRSDLMKDYINLGKDNCPDSLKKSNGSCTPPYTVKTLNSFSAILVSLQSTPTSISEEKTESNFCNMVRGLSISEKDCLESNYDRNNGNSFNRELCNDNDNIHFKSESTSTASRLSEEVSLNNNQNYGAISFGNLSRLPEDDGLRASLRNQYISQRSSSTSSIFDGELLIQTEHSQFDDISFHVSEKRKSLMPVDDYSFENIVTPSQTKPSVILSKMKTANFSSSSIMEDLRSLYDSTVKQTPSSYLSISQHKTKDSDFINATVLQTSPVPFGSSMHKNRNLFPVKFLTKRVYGNLLQHTVASKQKCRSKVFEKKENGGNQTSLFLKSMRNNKTIDTNKLKNNKIFY